MNTINSMIDALKNIYGDLLHEVILYGSYARGTQPAKSDVDSAILHALWYFLDKTKVSYS